MPLPLRAGLFATGVLLLLLAAVGPAAARPPHAEIVIDAVTGAVLHADNADTRTQPASLTKMMTLYMAFDALDRGELRLDQPIRVSAHAASMAPSKLGLKPGTSIQVEHAILALVTRSANDVAVVLAEAMAGSETQFAERMTAKARQLGMAATTFRNASGLPNKRQITTARDMATLSRALLTNHPRYYQYFGRGSFTYKGTVYRSHNRLMSRYDGMDGIKTGFVNASGFNLAASAKRDGRRLIAVVLGGTSAAARDKRVAALFDRAFGSPGIAQPAVASAARKSDPPAKVEKAATARPPTPPKKAAPASKAGWTIQVGTYLNARDAETGLDLTEKKLDPSLLNGAVPSVIKASSRRFVARYAGLSKANADTACRTLKKKGQDCLVLARK